MRVLSERQDMIINTINNRDFLMSPMSEEKYNELVEQIGEDALANEIYYLVQAGLVDRKAIIHSKTSGFFLDEENISLTAAGVDYANADAIGNKLNVVNIQIHQNTLDKLEAMIKAADISDAEKKSLLQLIKEKGSDAVIGRMVDYAFANVGIATKLFVEAAKDKLGFHN
ncbi:hypothetical protein [Moellerella wisconsensis]|uniref:hypothetical protein n=1 Tax=Moellerella wisconsensis TaxID=158849 RepID=UPI00240FA4AC|nr:hypothetical protein [Moellerella wisconsensis]